MEKMSRLKLNLKLTYESFIVILAELGKLISYWVLIKEDTLIIWKEYETRMQEFKKNLWK